jgi:hypothetical protein
LVDECVVCRNPGEPESEFCPLHGAAIGNLEQLYEDWCFAFGEKLSRIEYCQRVENLPETGNAVKGVVGFFRSKARNE